MASEQAIKNEVKGQRIEIDKYINKAGKKQGTRTRVGKKEAEP